MDNGSEVDSLIGNGNVRIYLIVYEGQDSRIPYFIQNQ